MLLFISRTNLFLSTPIDDDEMNPLEPVELLRRQYLQLLDPEILTLPEAQLLRLPSVQRQIYEALIVHEGLKYAPPHRYVFRVLKKIVSALERAIEDPEEDEISDELSGCLAGYMAHSLPVASVAAQEKCYVTYISPCTSILPMQITLLESPNLLAQSGTTGFRTWQAALFLACFLSSPAGTPYIAPHTRILELGAGTGLVSIMCAKYLGVPSVVATDGSEEVINDLNANLRLNGLPHDENIKSSTLRWGTSLTGHSVADLLVNEQYDLVLGADVTYDLDSMPALVATIKDLYEQNYNIKILISATARNEATLAMFLKSCDTDGFVTELLDIDISAIQTGFFHSTATPIRIYLITHQ